MGHQQRFKSLILLQLLAISVGLNLGQVSEYHLCSNSGHLRGKTLRFDGGGHIMRINPFDVDIEGLTACLWIKTADNQLKGTLVQYSTTRHVRELLLAVREMGPSKGVLVILGGTKSVQVPLILDDGHWHRLCLTWSGLSGTLKLFNDGKRVFKLDHFLTGPLTGQYGRFVVGQEHDGVNFFDSSKAFIGEMTSFNIWSGAIDEAQLRSNERGCLSDECGDLIDWTSFNQSEIHGVTIRNNSDNVCLNRMTTPESFMKSSSIPPQMITDSFTTEHKTNRDIKTNPSTHSTLGDDTSSRTSDFATQTKISEGVKQTPKFISMTEHHMTKSTLSGQTNGKHHTSSPIESVSTVTLTDKRQNLGGTAPRKTGLSYAATKTVLILVDFILLVFAIVVVYLAYDTWKGRRRAEYSIDNSP
ncbi:adhesion G-protein coupled receptor G4-like [Ptychodera flava]|uniref:adhesion G-protein coupled receptor G4-like n=1 Tax=Ptychodera flava TaxID=63121 RepID=UPI00396A915D